MWICSAVLLCLSLAISKVFIGSILIPLGIFGCVWNSLLLLCKLRLVAYNPISTRAYIIFLGSYVVFFLGSVTLFLGKRKFSRKDKIILERNRFVGPKCDLITIYRFIQIYGIISAIGTVIWLYRVWAVGGFYVFRSAEIFRAMNLGVK